MTTPGNLVWVLNPYEIPSPEKPKIGFVIQPATIADCRSFRLAINSGWWRVLVDSRIGLYHEAWICPLEAFPLEEND
jgi:hypothetical protein